MNIILKNFNFILFVSILLISNSIYSQSGSIKGTITDEQTSEPLPFSNVFLVSTGFGGSAKVDGSYSINNIPTGKYIIRVTYVGYKKIEQEIDISSNRVVEINFKLFPESLQGEEVVVTSQAIGQQHAINEQLNSISVKNVVSSARIQELPDANAAESVSRLPGISLIRTGGEGSQVVVRGLSPQYNRITIDGVELPGNIGSGSSDRATDLSMISSNMLGSIEVVKAITPDMDASVIGGTVNFGMRKAEKKATDPVYELVTQGTYNGLRESYNDYKLVGSVEQRFFDEKFGVLIQVNVEDKNLGANELDVNYILEDKSKGDEGLPLLNSMTLADVVRTRQRYGGDITLDYEHSSGEIGLMNFLSINDTKSSSRSESFPSDNGYITYNINNAPYKLTTFSNLLSAKQKVAMFDAEIKLSHSYSERDAPGSLNFSFLQPGGVNPSDVPNLRKLTPKELSSYVKHDATDGYLQSITYSNSITEDRTFSGGLDLKTDIAFSNYITGTLKFGGSYQYRKRSYNYEYWFGSMFDDGQTVVLAMADELNIKTVPLGTGGPLLTLAYDDFVDLDYEYGSFLDGDYELGSPANIDLVLEAGDIAIANAGTNPAQVGFKYQVASSKSSDYSGTEIKDAAYTMFILNIGSDITLIPGFRYQNLTTDYNGIRGLALIAGQLQYTKSSEKISHGYFLPMLNLKYRPLTWLQFHFAYTNTLNYPAYSIITPKYLIGESSISYNNYRLKPAQSENLDLALSIYNNEIGLFTVSGFNKNIKDLIFNTGARFPTSEKISEEFPEFPTEFLAGREFYTYINNTNMINVYGIEIDWQTHFWYLPQPFSGIVLNVNYTHIFSDAKYPRTERISLGYDPYTGTEKYEFIDTFYTARLLNQPNDIFNISAGYDYEGFSSRFSVSYKDNVFKEAAFWLQERVHSDKYLRFDLSLKQKLPWYGIQLFFNLNNITSEDDVDLNQKTAFPASRQRYGMTGDFGIRIKM
ncbi:MAG: TonB-dependent receptor [Ignavibacteriae bacterium]|nr:TonB-dependent receptor [Ignavibacteriota bacterium]